MPNYYAYGRSTQAEEIKKSTRCWELTEDLGVKGATFQTWRKQIVSDTYFKNLLMFLQPVGAKPRQSSWKGVQVQHILGSMEAMVAREGLVPRETDKLGAHYEIEYRRLGNALQKLFKFFNPTPMFEFKDIDNPALPHNIIEGLPRTMYLGGFKAGAGWRFLLPQEKMLMTPVEIAEQERKNERARRKFPVYFTIQNNFDDFEMVVKTLIKRNTKPFILMSPTDRFCSAETQQLLWDHQSELTPLTGKVNLLYAEELEVFPRHLKQVFLSRSLEGFRANFRNDIKTEDIFTQFHQFHYPELWEQRTKGPLDRAKRRLRDFYERLPETSIFLTVLILVGIGLGIYSYEKYLPIYIVSLIGLTFLIGLWMSGLLGPAILLGALIHGLEGGNAYAVLGIIIVGIVCFVVCDSSIWENQRRF